jgi:hypothetical protein
MNIESFIEYLHTLYTHASNNKSQYTSDRNNMQIVEDEIAKKLITDYSNIPSRIHTDQHSDTLPDNIWYDDKVEVLVFTYIDRGIKNWTSFANLLNVFYPNLKVLILAQNYSYDTDEKDFRTFLDMLKLDLFVIDDFQTDWLQQYKLTHKIPNTLIFGDLI